MDNEILFSERQKFKIWWLWLILLGLNGILIFGLYMQVIKGEQFGDNPMSDSGLMTFAGLSVLLSILFLNIRLETLIKNDGIHLQFFPFQLVFKKYNWESLNKVYVRDYAALIEYGGWGYRKGGLGNGTAYNISGDKGLQLELNNKNKLLIGTQKPDELHKVLLSIGQIKL